MADRRVMLIEWVKQAWAELHKNHGDLIQQTFKRLHLSLAIDGSEDNEIKIKDLPNIKVGDWHLDLPAGKQENIYNALDPNAPNNLSINAPVDTTGETLPEYTLVDEADAKSNAWDSEQDCKHDMTDED